MKTIQQMSIEHSFASITHYETAFNNRDHHTLFGMEDHAH